MDLAEMGVGDMGVDLGRRDVRVAEHGLDGTEVGAVHQEVGREGMTEGVGGDMLRDAGEAGVFFDDTGDGARGDAAVVTGSVGVTGETAVV